MKGKSIIALAASLLLLLTPSSTLWNASAKDGDDVVESIMRSYKNKDKKFFSQNMWGIMKVAILSMPKEERAQLKGVKALWVAAWEGCAEDVKSAFLSEIKVITSTMQSETETDEKGNKITMYYSLSSDGLYVENPICFVELAEKVQGQTVPPMLMYIKGSLPMDNAKDLVRQAS